tara:strand:- start:321 stop:992 length:672 start_codon:yes stop_codon:yes gene_type:complete
LNAANLMSSYETHGVFRPSGIQVREDRLLRLHGYRDLKKVRPVIVATAEDISRRAENLANPEIHYKRLRIKQCDANGLVLENGSRFDNIAFEKYLDGVVEVVVFAMTLGNALDEESQSLMEKFEPLEVLFLETAGWLGIEWTTRQFSEGLHISAKQNSLRVSCRMGPGYSYSVNGEKVRWSLEDQKPLFDVFDGDILPIELLESCAMLPKMSRSGLYGFAPAN